MLALLNLGLPELLCLGFLGVGSAAVIVGAFALGWVLGRRSEKRP